MTVSTQHLAVVGAGTMGAGIAQLAALKGFEVVVQEINDAALTAGIKKIEDLFQKAAERGLRQCGSSAFGHEGCGSHPREH